MSKIKKTIGQALRELNRPLRSHRDYEIYTDDGERPTAPPQKERKMKRSTESREMWAIYNGRQYAACETAVRHLPAGQFTIEYDNTIGIYFNKADINLDDLVMLPDSVSDNVINEIRSFWTKEEHFRKFGFLWKRGVLLWGPPGSGKTTTLQMISNEVIANGGISVYVGDPNLAAKGLKILRTVEPTRPLVVMLEDVDAIIDEHGESDLLALMDGELQIDNVVFVATTNYPEELDQRFVCRPSRFDVVRMIDMPTEDARRIFIQAKNKRLATPETEEELQQWVKYTKHFSIAHIKELIVSVEVFEVPFKEAVDRLNALINSQPKSGDSSIKNNFGFSSK